MLHVTRHIRYLSPNEGGSGNTTPLYIDFCMVLLGWNALRDAAAAATEASQENSARLQVQPLAPFEDGATATELERTVPRTLEGVKAWALGGAMELPRGELERHLFQFQRHFAGGQRRQMEAVSSGGGTRSINLAFESVLERARRAGIAPARVKCVTGTPHLAVERAERRFLFSVVRAFEGGVISLAALRREVRDPCVMAVYLQVRPLLATRYSLLATRYSLLAAD